MSEGDVFLIKRRFQGKELCGFVDPKTDGVNGTPRTSSETRSVNRSTRYVVWY